MTIVHASGNSAMNVVNTLHFDIDTAGVLTTMADIESVLVAMWSNVDSYISSEYSGCQVNYRWYRWLDTPPRVPVRANNVHTLTTGADRLPGELALCVNFHATYASGVPRGRQRGRVFFGPFTSSFLNNTTGRPDATKRDTLGTQFGSLLTASNADADWSWVVYSPTANATYSVVGLFWDDSWDTMRSRGLAPTTRLTNP
jgi:hypothetical protein